MDIFKTIYNWRRFIMMFTAICTALALIISLFMPNIYKAYSVFYASNTQQLDKQTLFNNKQFGSNFGGDDDMERLISIGESDTLLREMVLEFDLIKHYKIEKDDKLALYKAVKEFSNNYDISKNDHGAIELQFEDKDPVLCSKLVNTMVSKVDSIYFGIIRFNSNKMLEVITQQLADKENELRKVYDSTIYVKNSYNIINSGAQGKELSKELTKAQTDLAAQRAMLSVYQSDLGNRDTLTIKTKARVKGLESKIAQLTQNSSLYTNISKFKKGTELIDILFAHRNYLLEDINYLRQQKSQYEKALQTKISTVYVIQQAIVPKKKVRPVRSLLIVGVAFFSFLISLFGVLLYESLKTFSISEK